MRITKAELYDRYYSTSRNLYKEDKEMPNHCHNRVTFYPSGNNTDSSLDQIETIKDIFTGESVFTQIIPEPDWPNIPLAEKDVHRYSFSKAKGKVGELPVKVEAPFESYRFSSGEADDRWYDWRLQNWDTKWDCYDVIVTDDDPDQLEVEFNTAWSPPEAICSAIKEQYPDLAVSWFYDEPGCEIAGYL